MRWSTCLNRFDITFPIKIDGLFFRIAVHQLSMNNIYCHKLHVNELNLQTNENLKEEQTLINL